jgi:hypothetical protein
MLEEISLPILSLSLALAVITLKEEIILLLPEVLP